MALQHRWVLVLYHGCMEEMGRYEDDIWYNSLEECKQAAEAYNFDYCCGYYFEFESRPVEAHDIR